VCTLEPRRPPNRERCRCQLGRVALPSTCWYSRPRKLHPLGTLADTKRCLQHLGYTSSYSPDLGCSGGLDAPSTPQLASGSPLESPPQSWGPSQVVRRWSGVCWALVPRHDLVPPCKHKPKWPSRVRQIQCFPRYRGLGGDLYPWWEGSAKSESRPVAADRAPLADPISGESCRQRNRSHAPRLSLSRNPME